MFKIFKKTFKFLLNGETYLVTLLRYKASLLHGILIYTLHNWTMQLYIDLLSVLQELLAS